MSDNKRFNDLPELEAFYNGEFQQLLEAINAEWSWDRKAAYLLFTFGFPEDFNGYEGMSGEGWRNLLTGVDPMSKHYKDNSEALLAEGWKLKISAALGLLVEVEGPRLHITIPGKGWDAGKSFQLSVIVRAPGRPQTQVENEAIALDNRLASFDDVNEAINALKGFL